MSLVLDIAFIAPTCILDRVCWGHNAQMALAHIVLEDPDYAAFYRRCVEQHMRVILDCSTWELGSAMSPDDLFEACDMIGYPAELVLPDVYQDMYSTIQLTEDFVNGMAEIQKGSRVWEYNLVVPQGKDWEEWIRCYDYYVKQPYVHTIAIPKSLDDPERGFHPGGRIGAVTFLERTGRVDHSKRYHALGLWHDPIEILMLSGFDWITSLDCALPVHAGLQGVRFDTSFGVSRRRPRRPKQYFDLSLKVIAPELKTIDHNVMLALQWARGQYQLEMGVKGP